MKYLLLVVLYITLTYAHEVHLRDGITPKKFPPIKLNEDVVSNIDWAKLRSVVVNGERNLRAGYVQADVTNYTLEILHNVANLIIQAGLDPMGLSDITVDIFPGHIYLTNGSIQDLSSITVSDAVIAKYSVSTDILELTLPLAFDAVLLDFSYHVKFLLLGLYGSVDAKITDLKIDLRLGFNFAEYHAFVDKLDVKNSGNIDIQFRGLGLLDWLIDLMADALINIFHSLIFGIVDAVIYDPVQSVVTAINNLIDSVLNSNAANSMLLQ